MTNKDPLIQHLEDNLGEMKCGWTVSPCPMGLFVSQPIAGYATLSSIGISNHLLKTAGIKEKTLEANYYFQERNLLKHSQ